MKEQTYQLAGAKEAEGVLELAGSKEPAVLVLVDRMLQLTGAKEAENVLELAVLALALAKALALALAKSPQECQRLHCVLSVTGV